MVKRLNFGAPTATIDPPASVMGVQPVIIPTNENLPAAYTGPALQPFTMGEIADYGNVQGQQISAVAQTINAQTRAADVGAVGKVVGDILVVAKGYDPSKIKQGGGFLGLFKGKAQQFKNQFTSVDTQIREMTVELKNHQNMLRQRIPQMEQLAKDIEARHAAMGVVIAEAERRIAWMEANKPIVPEGDTFKAQELATWNTVIDMAKMRVHDLRILQVLAENQVPRIVQMQQQAAILLQKLQSIIDLVIPQWQSLLAEYIMQLGVKKTGELAHKVTDSFNEAQVQAAKLGRANAVAIANTQQRAVVDMATLKTVQQELMQSLTEVRQITDDGARRREQERPELERLSTELQRVLTNQPTAAV